ncbi:hypothetical protein CRG98_049834 [Punica granatum]|uniref:Uncharacterized protein n=1 Tax=Punica granatum TaxID=22663 RepID=A0A2I0H1T7_PUNGR|nr:hypothetical protein CRG98_049834 [Punica granatum]
MAMESAQEWLHKWLLELWQDDSLEKIQNDIQDGETESMDCIFTAYIHNICALIDHPVSHVLCAFFDRHCKDIPPCDSKSCFQHINSTLKTREDYELVIGHLALQAPENGFPLVRPGLWQLLFGETKKRESTSKKAIPDKIQPHGLEA